LIGGIIAVILLVVVVGGGFGVWYFMFRSTPTPTQAVVQQPTEAPVAVQGNTEQSAPLTASNTPAPDTVQENTPQQQDAGETATPIPPTDIATFTATNTPVPASPTPVPIELRVAYVVGSPGDTDIYAANSNGGNIMCIACSSSDEAEPEWSPDGEYVIFQANYSGSYDIWIMRSNGSGDAIQVTDNTSHDEREPHWSINSEVVYRMSPKDTSRNENGELWVTQINSSSYSLGLMGRGPVWSPDGTKIAFMSNTSGTWQIYVYNVNNGGVSQVTSCSVNCRWPAWSQDGQFVIFNATTAASNTVPGGIWYVPASGGSIVKLVDGGSAGRPGWSDSGWVAFNTNDGIEVVKSNGTSQQLLINEPLAWAPAWNH
jgi:hypothetical protein